MMDGHHHYETRSRRQSGREPQTVRRQLFAAGRARADGGNTSERPHDDFATPTTRPGRGSSDAAAAATAASRRLSIPSSGSVFLATPTDMRTTRPGLATSTTSWLGAETPSDDQTPRAGGPGIAPMAPPRTTAHRTRRSHVSRSSFSSVADSSMADSFTEHRRKISRPDDSDYIAAVEDYGDGAAAEEDEEIVFEDRTPVVTTQAPQAPYRKWARNLPKANTRFWLGRAADHTVESAAEHAPSQPLRHQVIADDSSLKSQADIIKPRAVQSWLEVWQFSVPAALADMDGAAGDTSVDDGDSAPSLPPLAATAEPSGRLRIAYRDASRRAIQKYVAALPQDAWMFEHDSRDLFEHSSGAAMDTVP